MSQECVPVFSPNTTTTTSAWEPDVQVLTNKTKQSCLFGWFRTKCDAAKVQFKTKERQSSENCQLPWYAAASVSVMQDNLYVLLTPSPVASVASSLSGSDKIKLETWQIHWGNTIRWREVKPPLPRSNTETLNNPTWLLKQVDYTDTGRQIVFSLSSTSSITAPRT